MLRGKYKREELGVKRGNIQWKVKVDNNILLFVNQGQGNKPDSTYIYENHLDKENDILYMCRDTDKGWKEKLAKELNEVDKVRIFYREDRKPQWYEFIYESIEIIDNGFRALGSDLEWR